MIPKSPSPEIIPQDIKQQSTENQPLLQPFPIIASINNNDLFIESVEIKHRDLVKRSKRISNYFIFAVWTGESQAAILMAVYILLAMTFTDYTHGALVALILTQQIARVIALLGISYFCDKYGFDKSLLVTSSFVVLGMILACVSYTMALLAVAIIIEAMSGYEAEIICAAFISKILPLNDASVYYGYLATAKAVGYLGGIIIAGIIATVFSSDGYRIALYFAVAFTIIRWVIIWWKMRDCQQSIVDEQMTFVEYYQQQNEQLIKQQLSKDSNSVQEINNDVYDEIQSDMSIHSTIIDDNTLNDKRFPLCLERMHEIRLENLNQPLIKYFYIFESPSLEGKSFWYYFDLMLHLVLWSFNGTYAVAFVAWYFVFVVDRFGVSLVIPSLQVGAAAFVFGVTAACTAHFVRGWSQLKQYILLIGCYSLRIFVMIFGIDYNLDNVYGVELFWIWCPSAAIIWAVGLITIQLMIIEQQPKRDTAKVTALKISLKYLFAGVLASFISAYWESSANYDVFELSFVTLDVISIAALVIMTVFKLYYYGFGFNVHSVK